MRRRGVWPVVALTVAGVGSGWLAAPAPARGDEDPKAAARFVQGLRDRGYFDLAAEQLEHLRTQPDTPAEFREVIDYELGRMLLEEASKSNDLVRRKEMLDEARGKLDAFTKAHPNHAKAPEALVEVARLLVERGHLAMLQADEAEAKAEKEAKLADARGSFDQARTAYNAAEERLKASFAKYPPYLPDNDPRKDEKERTHTALMNAQLQKAVVDYEQGQTYPVGAKERADFMGKALAQFEDLYKRYRVQMAGLTARMWQGKCYEERGDLGPAMGIYNELMEHADPRLRPLQRFVGYFRIIVLGKRKEHALAADEAVRWLQANNTPEAHRSKEGLGVQLELAKNIAAQLPEVKNENERAAAIRRITETLGQVVRYSSPFKAEAVALLREYKPSAAANATDVARLNYEDAVSQGEEAMASNEWGRAAAYLRQAVRRAEALRDIDKTNYARFQLAYTDYKLQRYYEAAVLGEHLARRYPQGGNSAKAAVLAMQCLADAYNTYSAVDRASDLNHLTELAEYTAETYPALEQGDDARIILGQIYHGTGRYPKAVEAFASVRPKSSKWVEAQTKLGASYWEQSQSLRRDGKAAEADAEQGKAVATLQAALKSRQDAGTPANDPGLVGNACDLADVYLKTGKADDALKLLDPLAKQPTPPTGPAFSRLMAHLLRAHIGTNQVDLAIADMTALEKSGGTGAGLTQLYYSLGTLLEKELDALRKKGDSAGLNRTQAAFQKFLAALVGSKSGQTYDSLQWAGENMLMLGHPGEAEAVFRQVLKTYENDPAFLARSGSGGLLLRTRVKLAAALRGQRNFAEAGSLVEQLIKENPGAIGPLMEKGMLREDEAEARKAKWGDAFAQWRAIAMRLGTARNKPVQYYEAWYHAALALNKEGKAKEAKQTLASIMRLSATVGGPEMKQKYKALLDQIK